MSGLVVDGTDALVVAVAASRVVPGLDPVEHRQRQLLAGVPLVLVEELALQAREERLGDAVVEQSPTLPIDPSSPAERSRFPKSHDVY